MRRLKPILWELGLASVIINLLALATPIFLMTVYNKVINHGALKTLDVLVIGMLTLFAFDWLLRSLRSYITSHAGGTAGRGARQRGRASSRASAAQDVRAGADRPDSWNGCASSTSCGLFFTSQIPLLLVDLAFVGVFLAVLFFLDLRLGAITHGRDPIVSS